MIVVIFIKMQSQWVCGSFLFAIDLCFFELINWSVLQHISQPAQAEASHTAQLQRRRVLIKGSDERDQRRTVYCTFLWEHQSFKRLSLIICCTLMWVEAICLSSTTISSSQSGYQFAVITLLTDVCWFMAGVGNYSFHGATRKTNNIVKGRSKKINSIGQGPL